MAIVLGSFTLDQPFARGGMGQVWRGVHRGQGLPVAVKVMTAWQAKNQGNIAAFRNEVRAVAAMNHPGVVLVFDYGEVDAQAAASSSDQLVEGCPWLAMELASGGSLKEFRGGLRWNDVRSVLVSLLDALAHSHARGVIHRDMKPGNVLVSGVGDLRPGIKLTDFGLAHPVDSTPALHQVTGTPLYMSPEQFGARWRDYGPWTDLYALGCMAWELACGKPPFHGRDVTRLYQQHLTEPLPEFEPHIPVPEGFEAWLRRLLEKAPLDRFTRAADAAWALVHLPDPPADLSTTSLSIASNPTVSLDETLLLAQPVPLPDPEPDGTVAHAMAVEVPPIPPSWKRADLVETPIQLLGAGLGLYGLRTVPLTGRVLERDALWDALVDAVRTGESRALVLRGASGNGKSRLVSWVAERAHEVGAATVLEAVHSPSPGAVDGLGPMVARHHRTAGLDREAVEARLRGALTEEGIGDPTEWMALTELLSPAPEGFDHPVVRLGTPEERYVLLRRLVQRLARHRPVVLWLDDVQWGLDAIAFARFLVEEPPIGPVLLLLTAQEEALAEADEAREALSGLTGLHGVHTVAVDALESADRLALVKALLGLEGELAERLADRTGGNPLFTVQLVGDWVARGILVPTRDGFVLQEGEAVSLPDNLHQVWSGRLDRLLEGTGSAARAALEVAAALGQDVVTGEWLDICAEAGLTPPADLLERLVTTRLANERGDTWSFAHGMLRESLQRLSTEAGRWAAHNRACARTLARRGGDEARLGRHLLAAGEHTEALHHLHAAVQACLAGEDLRRARPLLLQHDDALRRLALAPDDPRLGQAWLLRARVYLQLEELDQAALEARRALAMAERHGWEAVRPEALDLQAQVSKARGNLHRAETFFLQALEGYTAVRAPLLPACHISLAHTLILGGRTNEARSHISAAQRLFEETRDRSGLGRCLRFLGDIARLEGHGDEAAILFRDAAAHHRSAGDRASEAMAMHGVAEMDRLRGALDEAERGYREVLAIEDARGQPGWIPRLNLCLCLIARERYPEARQGLGELLKVWREQRKRGYVAAVHCALLPCAAAAADWDAFDDHLDQAGVLLDASGMVDVDVAQTVERAGVIAAGAGERDRARLALELAVDHWRKLGDDGATAAAQARLEALL